MQDALFENGVAPSSTLSFIGSTQVRLRALTQPFTLPFRRWPLPPSCTRAAADSIA